jgi:2-polyprenyl-3-methyl-5-hydroxy-6-metoxy-1,4-benzoquinol methylase
MQDWRNKLYESYISSGHEKVAADYNYLEPSIQKIIDNYLPEKRDISILDLGCGNGRLLYNLKQKGYTNLRGVDTSQEQIDAAHKMGVKETCCRPISDFLKDIQDASLDVVFLISVLEHMEKPEVLSLLDKITALLKPDGLLIIHVPNAGGIFGLRVFYSDFTHCWAYTEKSLRQLLGTYKYVDIQFMEDRPLPDSFKGAVRSLLWVLMSLPLRIMLTTAKGKGRYVLSQNMLTVARKPG